MEKWHVETAVFATSVDTGNIIFLKHTGGSNERKGTAGHQAEAAGIQACGENWTYLIHYDSGKRVYWTNTENKNLFALKKRGRKKRD